MPTRGPHKRHSSRTGPLLECSHTREVTDDFVAQFYFSLGSRKKTCRRVRLSAAAPGAGILRGARRIRAGIARLGSASGAGAPS
jgi:hypothetical protein